MSAEAAFRAAGYRIAFAQSATVYAALRDERPLPAWWQRIAKDDEGAAWQHRSNGLRVIESVLPYGAHDELWHHVSVSRASRLPSWDDLKLVRADFIGHDRECYQVFPPETRWVNDHAFVLHLWCCLERPQGVLPDFRIEGSV